MNDPDIANKKSPSECHPLSKSDAPNNVISTSNACKYPQIMDMGNKSRY